MVGDLLLQNFCPKGKKDLDNAKHYQDRPAKGGQKFDSHNKE
jgi:hypothetical protein